MAVVTRLKGAHGCAEILRVELQAVASTLGFKHLTKPGGEAFEVLHGRGEFLGIRHGQGGKECGQVVLGLLGILRGLRLDRIQKVPHERQREHDHVGGRAHGHGLRLGHPKRMRGEVSGGSRIRHDASGGNAPVVGVHLGGVLIDLGAAVIFGHFFIRSFVAVVVVLSLKAPGRLRLHPLRPPPRSPRQAPCRQR